MEGRLNRLEQTVAQQGYMILILMVLLILDTGGLLVLWGESGEPDWDHIAVSLTIFQTLFGIAALYGFWALRALTKEKAEEVARERVEQLVPDLSSQVTRQVGELLRTFNEGISTAATDDLTRAAGEDGKEGFDGQE